MATKEFDEFVAGWNSWVGWDHNYPDDPSPAFVAGNEAAAYQNDHGGGMRPQIAQRDENCEQAWKKYQKRQSHCVEQPLPSGLQLPALREQRDQLKASLKEIEDRIRNLEEAVEVDDSDDDYHHEPVRTWREDFHSDG